MPIDSTANFGYDLKNMTANKAYSNKKYNRSYFLLLNDGTNYQAYVMLIMADSTYVKNDLSKLNHNSYRKNDVDFTGMVLYFTPDGNYVNGYAYQNGQLILPASASGQTTQNIKNPGLKTDVSSPTPDCTDWYLDTYVNDVLVSSEYIGSTCVITGTGNSAGGSSPAPPPTCTAGGGTGVQSTGGLTVNVAGPPPGGGTNPTPPGQTPPSNPNPGTGFPPPGDPCPTDNTGADFGEDNPNTCLNCRVSDDNFDDLLDYSESVGDSFNPPMPGTYTSNGVDYSGEFTQIFNSAGQLVATYFSPDESNGPFQVGTEYIVGNTGGTGTNGSTGSSGSTSGSGSIGSGGLGFGNPAGYLGNSSGGSTITLTTPPEGFRPLCKSSIILKPFSSNTNQVNLSVCVFGILDMPSIFNGERTLSHVIAFNLQITIPTVIKDPTNTSLNYTITYAMQQEYIYQAYHYASEQLNIAHGLDFFSAGAQPVYSLKFAALVTYYLNFIALQGVFPAYENANPGSVPSLGARASTQINISLATPAVYAIGVTGEGC